MRLNGGEDYELLFTISQDHYDKLKKDVDFTIIGHVTDKKEGNNFITKDSTSHPITAPGMGSIKINLKTPQTSWRCFKYKTHE